MLRRWKCLHASGYIWTIESNAEKGTLKIIDHNDKVVHEEKNVRKETLQAVENHYTGCDDKPKDCKDAIQLMYG